MRGAHVGRKSRKRWLHALIQPTLALAMGFVSAYGFMLVHERAGTTAPTGTSLFFAVLGAPVLPFTADEPASAAPRREHPMEIVTYRDAVTRAGPSVVTVHSAHVTRSALPLGPDVTVTGLGSGVIIDADGYVVTNYHVVADATELAVALSDGTLHLAHLAGIDPPSDIALLKIDADHPRPIILADVNDIAVGDVVLAVGNPLGVGQTVTQGIISAIVRKGVSPVENFIQTDAAINPGNSGGALIDTAGRLVGINTLILSHSGGSEGIGFAIPADYVRTVAAELKAKGRVARAWLGLSTAAPPEGTGALVLAVVQGGPAARAGIASGDIIVRFGERIVEHAQDLRGVVIGSDPGTRVPVEMLRNDTRVTVEVELAPLPVTPPAR